MKVLITGAAGFLGRHFVWHHLDMDDDVIAVDDLSNEHSYWPLGSYEKWKSDVREAIRYIRLKKIDLDMVYHFAAPVGGRMKIEHDPLFNAESLEIDSAVIRWLASLDKKPLLVYPSSSAVYPVYLQNETTSSMVEGMFRPSNQRWGAPDEAYGFVKMAAELLLDKASRYGLESIILRPFSGYGEGQSQEYPFPTIMRKVARQDPEITIWGSGSQVRDFIHVDDIVGATQALIDAEFRGAMNLATGVGTSMTELLILALNNQGYSPQTVDYDTSKPEGVMHRVGSTELLDNFYRPKVSLEQGTRRVLEYERTQI